MKIGSRGVTSTLTTPADHVARGCVDGELLLSCAAVLVTRQQPRRYTSRQIVSCSPSDPSLPGQRRSPSRTLACRPLRRAKHTLEIPRAQTHPHACSFEGFAELENLDNLCQ